MNNSTLYTIAYATAWELIATVSEEYEKKGEEFRQQGIHDLIEHSDMAKSVGLLLLPDLLNARDFILSRARWTGKNIEKAQLKQIALEEALHGQ